MNLLERLNDRSDARYFAQHRWDRLARYNDERAHGIVHTPEWDETMAMEQEHFEAWLEENR